MTTKRKSCPSCDGTGLDTIRISLGMNPRCVTCAGQGTVLRNETSIPLDQTTTPGDRNRASAWKRR